MARQPSSIDKLPAEIRDVIAGLRRQGLTIDEIRDHLLALDVDVSRSALGRHVKTIAEVGERMRRADAISKAIVDKFGDQTDDRVARASMHILQGVILDLTVAQEEDEDGNPVSISPETVKSLALALQRLTAAQRMDAERELKMRAEFAREAAQKLDGAARDGAIDPEAVERAKRILGFG
jgi:hypothetical protein